MIFDKIVEKVAGKLEKMIIMGFKDDEEAKNGTASMVRDSENYFEAYINPEDYKLNYKVKYDCQPAASGSDGKQQKFQSVAPEELSFKFLFDDTGIIDGDWRNILKKPNSGVFDEVKKFRELLVRYYGDSHQTKSLVLVWGNLIFKGRVVDLSIEYKLFNSNGEPIRAVANVKFVGSIEENKNEALKKKSSPDLTHILRVKAGDTLPLMCKKVYGDPKYYLQVANVNGLGNFRRLVPGMELVFPPIDKSTN